MSEADKQLTMAVAMKIVDNVIDDARDPIPTVRWEANQIHADPNTLVLWLAQMLTGR
jgi:hypothetical protein